MSDERFDMITADPIHPRVTGVGFLYTREYYESLKQRLKPDAFMAGGFGGLHIAFGIVIWRKHGG